MENRYKMTLKLKNNATKAEIVLDVTDKSESCMYYVFDIQLESPVDEGEYTYQLFNLNDKVVATGLMQIGDYVAEHTTYNNENQEYIVYGG